MRKTKIVATLGPATEKEETIKELIEAGVNVFRFNLKYSPQEWHNREIALIRKQAKKLKKRMGILIDTPQNDLRLQIEDMDWIALSYLKEANEVEKLKERLKRSGKFPKVMAKIENGSAIKNLEKIMAVSDGIMVARGDLGREMPIEELALFQKRIVDMARINSKPVIVATEMLYSMVENDSPTRAEATDVANAVFDGTDALMLSEETAMGNNPIKAVEVMGRIASFAETSGELRKPDLRARTLVESLTESAARMACENLEKPIKAIIVFTRSGATVTRLARHRLEIPIIAISNDELVLNQLNLSFGTIPFKKQFNDDKYAINNPIFGEIKNTGLLKTGDTVLIIHGDSWFGEGPANRLSIQTV